MSKIVLALAASAICGLAAPAISAPASAGAFGLLQTSRSLVDGLERVDYSYHRGSYYRPRYGYGYGYHYGYPYAYGGWRYDRPRTYSERRYR